MVFFSSRISPLASTVIFFERSPFAIEVVTSAMFRTCAVRLFASRLTLSVRSFHVPATPGTSACAPSFPSTPTVRATSGNLFGEQAERRGHAVDGVGQRRDLAARVDDQFLRQVAVGDRGHDLDDAAHLGREVRRHEIDVVGQVLPDARYALHFGLAAELALGADLARDTGNFRGERSKLIHHRVHGVLQFEDFALNVDGDLLRQVAVGDRGRDGCDIADLVGQVARQHVDVVCQILPGARHALDLRLAAELAVGADFLGDARNLVGEGAQLIDHRVNRGADSQELALDRLAVDFERHFLTEVALRDRADHASDLGSRLHEAADQ